MAALWLRTAIEIRLAFRDRTAAFWGFVFPLLMLLFFHAGFRVMGEAAGGLGDHLPGGYVAFSLPGLVAMATLSTCLLGGAQTLAADRERRFLKLLGATPLSLGAFFLYRVLAQLVVSVAQFALLAGVAVGWLGVRVEGSWGLLILLFLTGMAVFTLVGFSVASAARTRGAAEAVANMLYMPMVLVSGAFFPVQVLPGPVQWLANLMPLKPFLDGFRAVMTGNSGWEAVVPAVAVLAGWGIAAFAVAQRLFRWVPLDR